jgi:sphingolipid 4-desaturase/C4-monooxygenase
MVERPGFEVSASREPHRARTQAILTEHPAIRDLIGKNRYSFLIIVALVAGQFALAWSLQSAPWWAVLCVAYLAGAFIDHALFVMIHECAHNLIFRSRLANMLSGMLANLPLTLPSSVSFQRYHLRHHAFQGVYELDADLPSEWEARLVGRSPLAKAVWLAVYPALLVTRALRLKEVRIVDGWLLINLATVLAADGLVCWFWSAKALIYLASSFVFSVGLHPVGARWIQEHYLVHSPQETYSYYGVLNRVAFNVGYHNEHHDFPSIPWSRLPAVRSLAARQYDSLVAHRSWTRLMLRFLFDRQLLLFSRMTRSYPGLVPHPHTAYEPEQELSRQGEDSSRR